MSEHNGHTLVKVDGRWTCETCGLSWTTNTPALRCPQMPAYRWRAWTEHLMLKFDLDKAGYSVTKSALPPVVAKAYSMEGHKWYNLYDVNGAKKKRPLTEAQKAAHEKMRGATRCWDCGAIIPPAKRGADICDKCKQRRIDAIEAKEQRVKHDHNTAAFWARELLTREFIVMDTETTGLHNAEIIEIAIVNQDGETLMNQRIKPLKPSRMTREAVQVHGITVEMLQDEPTLSDIYQQLFDIINGAWLVVYNASFDIGILERTLDERGLDMPNPKSEDCAMEAYAAYVGQWSDYWGDYKYQPLPGGDHSALGDCLATLDLIKFMARNGDVQ